MIADCGYDSNAALAVLVKRDIKPIIPARHNNRTATHQYGRKLRRYIPPLPLGEGGVRAG
jgi:hypothetical protein